MATPQQGTTGAFELDFERPLARLEQQIAELERQPAQSGVDMSSELDRLRENHQEMLRKIYSSLGAWNVVQVARHPSRPQALDYLDGCVKDFCELHGDRRYGDDRAVITGFGRIGRHKCLVVALHKGRDVKERLAHNFGMAHPEGYRKALHKMKLAEKFGLPVVTLIDTPGAYPGIGAEERGQAEAIAQNLAEMSNLRVPIVSVIIGEGGSGGALGVAVADRTAMLEYSWFTVISPEGCASILWKTGEKASEAAERLKLTAEDNIRNGVIDEMIEEPLGAAHRDAGATIEAVEDYITRTLRELKRYKIDNLLAKRYRRLRRIGAYREDVADHAGGNGNGKS